MLRCDLSNTLYVYIAFVVSKPHTWRNGCTIMRMWMTDFDPFRLVEHAKITLFFDQYVILFIYGASVRNYIVCETKQTTKSRVFCMRLRWEHFHEIGLKWKKKRRNVWYKNSLLILIPAGSRHTQNFHIPQLIAEQFKL